MTLKRIAAVLFSVVTLVTGVAAEALLPESPNPQRLVCDLAGAFPAAFADSLENALVAFDDSTSNQICVATISDLGDQDVAQYALRLANKWGVGSSRNNGVMVLLMPRGPLGYVDITIQVGRGLEGAIPDVYASRIIRNIMGPYLKQDRYGEAIARGCEELMKLASGEISEPRDRSEDDSDAAFGAFVLFILFVVVCIIVIRLDRKMRRGGGNRGGGSNIHFGGFGGGSGSGFSSGSFGGSSFGSRGGFSGGGFGGFGGGSFGGGGASGRF